MSQNYTKNVPITLRRERYTRLNEYCGSRRGTHAVMSMECEIVFGKTPWRNARKWLSNTPDISSPIESKVTFWDQNATTIWVWMWSTRDQITRDDHPDNLKSDPKSTFSRPVSLPQNEWCSHPKTQNDIFGPKHHNNLGFKVSCSKQIYPGRNA